MALLRKALLSGIVLASIFAASSCSDSPYRELTGEESGDATDGSGAVDPEIEPNGTIIDIQMYTNDPDEPDGLQVFKPRIVTAQVGDTVRFIPTDPSHQSSSIPTMLPEGARGWAGEINQEVSYVLPKPGIYGYQCVPHYAAGMVGIIIVEGEGKTANLARARAVAHPGLGGREFTEIFEQAEADGMFD